MLEKNIKNTFGENIKNNFNSSGSCPNDGTKMHDVLGNFGLIHFIFRFDEHLEEVVAGEFVALPLGVSSAEFSHALTVAVAHPQGEIGGDDAFVAQTAEEASLPAVFGKGKETDIRGMIVGGDAVHVVGGLALGDEFAVFGDVRGMRGKETFVMTKSISEIPVALFASSVVAFGVRGVCGTGVLYVAYSAGGIDGDAFGGGEVAIESDVVRAVGSDIAEEDAAVDECVPDAVGVTVYIFACH